MAFVADVFVANGGVNSLTAGSITASGSNRHAFLAVYAEGVTVTSISYGAQTPSAISGAVLNPYGSDTWQIYGLVSPGTSAVTPSVNFSGSATRCFLYVAVWDDVGTIGTPSTLFTEGGASSSLNATSSAGQTVVDYIVAAEASITPDASQTSREVQNNFVSSFRSFGSSSKTAAGATTNMLWTPAGACDLQHIAVPFSAAGGGGGTGLDIPRNISLLTAVNRAANF